MKSDQERSATDDSHAVPTYYLILDDVAATTQSDLFEVNPEELNEIEQIGRLVLEVTNDPPVFMTST